jgi:triosephosphate isomerase
MKKPRLIVAGNWKMNSSLADSTRYLEALGTGLASLPRPLAIDVVIAAPFTLLANCMQTARRTDIQIAAQNVHWADTGAFTGETSCSMLKELGVNWTLIGHSERRQFFGETDVTVRQRAQQAFHQGIRPIICIGETLAEREAGKTEAVVSRQLEAFIEVLPKSGEFAIAYEPVWAIGTGKTATPQQAEEVHAFIRARLKSANLESTPLLYGGSVKPDNFAQLLAQPNVDGALIGGASLVAADFLSMVRTAVSLRDKK